MAFLYVVYIDLLVVRCEGINMQSFLNVEVEEEAVSVSARVRGTICDRAARVRRRARRRLEERARARRVRHCCLSRATTSPLASTSDEKARKAPCKSSMMPAFTANSASEGVINGPLSCGDLTSTEVATYARTRI